jgi:hypothetical protein
MAMTDARYLARLLLALVACCLLALSLYQDAPRGSVADIVRDRIFLGLGR